jgi:hypothetical protein
MKGGRGMAVGDNKSAQINKVIYKIYLWFSWLAFIFVLTGAVILWIMSKNSLYVFCGVISIFGILANLMFVWHEKKID